MNIPIRQLAVAACLLVGLDVGAQSNSAIALDKALDKSIAELQGDMEAGRMTSEQLVEKLLRRIDALDRKGPSLRTINSLNPEAIAIARELDKERREHRVRGPLHGIPILLKDNIESADKMPTTAGSLALSQNFAVHDAPIVANLRAAGAIILGKTNLSEWANFRSLHSISGWSAVGGLTKNPHVLDRSACGSSAGSGAATAAVFAVATVGSETDGSVVCPSSMNGVVGLKPTLGLLSSKGIVPISHSQDTAGPMARSVADAAAVLDGMLGNKRDYAAALSSDSLKGKRIGVWRFKPDRIPKVDPIYERALKVLHDAGAVLVDLPIPDTSKVEAAEEIVLVTEFKADLNAYLSTTPVAVSNRTLEKLIAFNKTDRHEMSLFGQEWFVRANATKGLDDPAYKSALEESKKLAGVEGIDRALASQKLDFLVAPTVGPAWRVDVVSGDANPDSFTTLPAVAGYPHLTVPMGLVDKLPVGISFIGPSKSDALLLSVGYAHEQKAKNRIRPSFMASAEPQVEAELRGIR